MMHPLTDAIELLADSPGLALVVKATIVLLLGRAALSLAHRARAATRHMLIACTFGTLLLLPPVLWFVPGFAIHIPGSAAIAGNASPTDAIKSNAQNGAAPAITNHVAQDAAHTRPFAPQSLALTLWIAGMVFVLASSASGLRRVAHLRRTSLPWTGDRRVFAELIARVGILRPVELLIHEDVAAPFACGALKPAILLPVDSVDWNDADVRRALAHELEHLRRCDWIIHLITRATCALYWFHPLVWSAWRRLAVEAERACDDAVLQHSDNAEYAEQLISLARRLSGSVIQPTLAMANRSDLTTRISAILDSTQRRGRLRALPAAVAVASMALVTLAMAPMRAIPAAPIVSAVVPATIARECHTKRLQASLLDAAEYGDLRDISSLIDAGADVNCAVEGDGSALIVAARNGRLRAAQLLLDHGADPNMAVHGDGNPLIAAAAKGQLHVVQLLLDRGARINEVVPDDENALIQASGGGHFAVVSLLVARGADVNARVWVPPTEWRPHGEWRTPLAMARKDHHNNVVAFLVAAGARD